MSTRFFRTVSVLLLAAAGLAAVAPHARAQDSSPLIIVPKKGNPDQMISFSFQGASIDDVLKFLADVSGKIVFKDSTVQMPITIRNQGQIRVSQAIKLLRSE